MSGFNSPQEIDAGTPAASSVTNIPAGDISSTDVQAAINELDTEKLGTTGVGSNLTIARVSGSTYSTVQHMQDIFHSAGVSTGGGITDDADGTITVAAGTGFIRATDSAVAEILYFDWAAEAGANVALTDNDMNYIYAEYNAGSPLVVATITLRIDENTNVFLGTIYRSGTSLHVTESTRAIVGDHALNMIKRLRETAPFQRVSGGIVSETGTRNIAITAGDWWSELTNFTTTALDTSISGDFIYYYSDGASGFTAVATQTLIDNTQYDDGSGTLATLSNAKYGVHWLYLGQDSDFYVLYGTVDGSLTAAQDASAPADLPPHFAEAHARLVGKVIILKSASTFASILTAFNGDFSLGTAADHGGLFGLGDDDHTQYSLISSQAGAPSSTPSRVGEVNVDTTADAAYIAVGTASSSDWSEVNASGGGTPESFMVANFDNSGRYFSATGGSGVVTFGAGTTNGVNLTVSSAAASYSRVRWLVSSSSNVISDSPTFSAKINHNGGANDWTLFAGYGNPTVATTGFTFTVKHIGFKIVRIAGGTINIYATQGDGTTENSSLVTTMINGSEVDLILKVNGTSSVDYYVRSHNSALTAATNLTTNIPTSGLTEEIDISVSTDNTTSQPTFNIMGASHRR